MHVELDFISASCNLTYNSLELTADLLIYGANHALAVYDLHEGRVANTFVEHEGRVNCVRFLKSSKEKWILSSGTDGRLNVWENLTTAATDKVPFAIRPRLVHQAREGSVVVCDGILGAEEKFIIGYITSLSKVIICEASVSPGTSGTVEIVQEVDLKQSVALDLVFHMLLPQNELVLGLGMDSGEVALYGKQAHDTNQLLKMCSLKKHEDWVRCMTFISLEDGDTLLATGGEDSFIAIWRFSQAQAEDSGSDDYEFQIQHFQTSKILFDSMIIGHEGWINSLQWNARGELISCSSDHSIIIWENLGEIWTEKSRLGTVGGQIPGGFGAKFNVNTVVTWGFQGSIQIWSKLNDEWIVKPSGTGHFGPVSDMDYHPKGLFIVTTSVDQTTRVFAPSGLSQSQWHEIGRPQIHGHDIFAVKCCGDFIVSGAEEKILRAFQPTEIFVANLEETSEISVNLENVAHQSATLPALGLSNQTGSWEETGDGDWAEKSLESRLDEDFLRTHTLWPEVSKLYGHVYEICCIAASPKDPLVASASQSSKPQFSAIILWCAKTWKNFGEFPLHKLNVTDMEFSPDGMRLLSVSRDRTWALWNVFRKAETGLLSMEVLETGGYHTRALWVGTWAPQATFFVTGARDKKLVLWKSAEESEKKKFERNSVQVFDYSVTSAAINEDNVIAVGVESGLIFLLQFSPDVSGTTSRLESLIKLDKNLAHHDVVKRLKFNPKEKYQLASVGADRFLKVYQLGPLSS